MQEIGNQIGSNYLGHKNFEPSILIRFTYRMYNTYVARLTLIEQTLFPMWRNFDFLLNEMMKLLKPVMKIDLFLYTVFPQIVSVETILFWIWPYALWPVTVHKSVETIQGRKLFAEILYE